MIYRANLKPSINPYWEVTKTMTTTASTKLKPRASYTNVEKIASSDNAKPLNIIFWALEDKETNPISACTIAYDTWEALKHAYEVDDKVQE